MGANQHPLDDPAPMGAYRGRHNHNLLSALRFGGSEREKTAGSSTPENLFDLMISAAKSMGIKHTRAKSLIQHLYTVTSDFAGDATEILVAVPVDRRPNSLSPDINGFCQTINEVRAAISRDWTCIGLTKD